MLRLYNVYLMLFILASCSCATSKVADPQSAVGSNDLTALISGCGQQQVGVGYIVCRMREGQTTQLEQIRVHAPPNLTCDEDACVFFRIYFPDGRPTYEGVVKKGESFAQVPFSEIVDKKTFDISDRGFYGVSVTLHYKDSNGVACRTYADGYIFMHVVKKEYVSLIENQEDENFVWTWKTKANQTIKMTTGFRVFVSNSSL
jgi:hypothetical protein